MPKELSQSWENGFSVNFGAIEPSLAAIAAYHEDQPLKAILPIDDSGSVLAAAAGEAGTGRRGRRGAVRGAAANGGWRSVGRLDEQREAAPGDDADRIAGRDDGAVLDAPVDDLRQIKGVTDLIIRRMGRDLLAAVERGEKKNHGPIPKAAPSGQQAMEAKARSADDADAVVRHQRTADPHHDRPVISHR